MSRRDPLPQYRFRGSTPPKAGIRTPLRNEAASALDETGSALVRIYDPIDSWGGDWGISAKEFAQMLDEIPDANEIRLHINSPGGEVYEAVAILNQLRNHPAKIVATVDGIAASAASFIATGADETIMGRNSQLMIHDAWGICIGPAVDMRDMGKQLDQLSDNIAGIYADKSGGTVADWRALMLAETWLSADEAVELKLADRVESDEPEPAVLNHFDLSVFSRRDDVSTVEPAPEIVAPAGPSPAQRARHAQNSRTPSGERR